MRALVVYCHPNPASFTAAVRDTVLERLDAAGAEVRLRDLYADGFDPVLSRHDLEVYAETPENRAKVEDAAGDVAWCDALIFVYPTWWYGLPAMLKGWLDRVLLPEVAFHMPDAEHPNIRPGLTHITRLGIFTTCGAGRWLTWFVGAPGKRTLMRGVGMLCAKPLRRVFTAHYLMDSATPATRARHLDRVAQKIDHLIGSQPISDKKAAAA